MSNSTRRTQPMAAEVVELLKEAKKASEQGLDAKTFERVCKDKAKVKP